jgi:AbrB family looped-hinge helix DNA binding protein
MSTATITAKGQITIPKEIRNALDLKAGDQVFFLIESDWAILVPVRQRSIIQLRGSLSSSNPFSGHQDIREATGYERGQGLAQEEST